jgi:hypothetical protein
MAELHLQFTLDPAAFQRMLQQIPAALDCSMPGPIQDGMKQAAARYLAFIRRRFDAASKGDGTWPDLALSTKLARLRKTKAGQKKLAAAKKKAGRYAGMAKRLGGESAAVRDVFKTTLAQQVAMMKFSILRDTNTLFNSLTLGAPGSLEEVTHEGIRVGTAIEYAHEHQNPTVPGRPPQRLILVPPDPDTQRAMNDYIARGVARAIQQKGRIQ